MGLHCKKVKSPKPRECMENGMAIFIEITVLWNSAEIFAVLRNKIENTIIRTEVRNYKQKWDVVEDEEDKVMMKTEMYINLKLTERIFIFIIYNIWQCVLTRDSMSAMCFNVGNDHAVSGILLKKRYKFYQMGRNRPFRK